MKQEVPNAVVPGSGMERLIVLLARRVLLFTSTPAIHESGKRSRAGVLCSTNVLAKKALFVLRRTASRTIFLSGLLLASIWKSTRCSGRFSDDVPSSTKQKRGAQGAKVHTYLIAQVLYHEFHTYKPVSLVDYLPEDLES